MAAKDLKPHEEDQFINKYCRNYTDSDVFAFAALQTVLKEKLRKMRVELQQSVRTVDRHNSYPNHLYRIVRQQAVCKLAGAQMAKELF